MDTCLTCGKKVVDLTPAMLSSGGPGWWCLCPPAPLPEPVFLNEEPPAQESEPATETGSTFTPSEPDPNAPPSEPAVPAPAAVPEEGVQ